MKIRTAIAGIFNTKVDAVGLSVFRMLYSVMLMGEITGLYRFRHIIFDRDPFVNAGEIDFGFIYLFWMISLLALFFGFKTRLAALINFIFGVIIFGSALKFEYHIYYSYLGVNFLLPFLPLSRVFSIDSLIEKVRYTYIGRHFKPDRTVLEVNYLLPVFAGIGLVYFDSIFLKLDNNLWTSGMGVWLPTSIPPVAWHDMTFLLNQEWLMYFLGYFVLAFETVFIFLFWFRKWRIPLMLIGIFFHIGIFVCYPIPYFALTYVVLYLLLLPPSFWLWISKSVKSQKQVYTFYYDAECPLCNKVVVVIRHLDVFNRVKCLTVQGNYQNDPAVKHLDEETLFINIHGVTESGKVRVGFWAYVELFKAIGYTFPLGLLISLPGISAIGKKVYAYIAGERLTVRCTSENCSIPVISEPVSETTDILVSGWNRLAITQKFWKWLIALFFIFQCLLIARVVPSVISDITTKYLGLTRHTVFLDFHFEGYNHEIKVMYVSQDGKEILVPVINEDGTPGDYSMGPTWRNISFDVISQVLKPAKFETRIKPYLLYFLDEHGINADGAKFRYYIKELDTPKLWEKDFLHKQMEKPWVPAGESTFEKKTAVFTWNAHMQQVFENEAR
ncbi:DCC1-like thiol-disulfide oxidoreductase family protein [Flavobacterium silvaticum]|uniref:DUF393 domain-containing protein n=1 Tax=Flavobacterium silvaticum TaxID=1852020 RepID=A0A972FPK9_9FLAO|nr:DCC1-like thiol-disulfide oxidoreductase family protein [Flavobacterium silvaticum]NMH29523.1 DUF393 domain-containing protein [Flavobacterium silvaticum]